jgi:hypothetical protein
MGHVYIQLRPWHKMLVYKDVSCVQKTLSLGFCFFVFQFITIDAYRQSMCSIDTCPRQLMQMLLCLDAYMHVARSHHTRELDADSYPSSMVRWLLGLILTRASGTGMMARRRWLASRVLPTTFCRVVRVSLSWSSCVATRQPESRPRLLSFGFDSSCKQALWHYCVA